MTKSLDPLDHLCQHLSETYSGCIYTTHATHMCCTPNQQVTLKFLPPLAPLGTSHNPK